MDQQSLLFYFIFFFILCLDSSNLHQKWNIVIISSILICFVDVYVVVNFLSQIIFVFLLFLGRVI